MKALTKLLMILFFSAGLSALAGCRSSAGYVQNSRPLPADAQALTSLGRVEASTSLYRILGFPLGSLDLNAVIDEAKKKKKADALVKLSWHERRVDLFVFAWSSWSIHGEAVKFESGEDKSQK